MDACLDAICVLLSDVFRVWRLCDGAKDAPLRSDESEDVREGKTAAALLFPALLELRIVPLVWGRSGLADAILSKSDKE